MTPLTFAAALFDYLQHSAGMADTVAAWMESESEPEQREVLFAVLIAEDFEAMFHNLADDDCDESRLFGRLALLVSSHTNWRSIARRLIRRFTTPAAMFYPGLRIDSDGYSTGAAWN